MPRGKRKPKPAAPTITDFQSIAMRAGFKVSERNGAWVIHVPARKRHPANVQGDFKSADRAWLAAASLAMEK
jgi:hypothetical protein